MAVCGSLQHIFEKPLPENPTLIESLSQWNRHQMKTRKSLDLPSFSEIFGELHFHEKKNHHHTHRLPDSSSSPPHSSFSLEPLVIQEDKDGNADDKEKDNTDDNPSSSSSSSTLSSLSSLDSQRSNHSQYEGFCCKSSESLQFCTEGLGSESADDVEDFSPPIAYNEGFVLDDTSTNEEYEEEDEEEEMMENSSSHFLSCRRSSFGSSSGATSFPPPISCIGRSGKPWVCFRSFRRDGRFVLKEIRIPTHEFLRACREDGRLRLHFVQPDEEIPEEEEEEEEEDEEDEEEDEEDEKEDNVVVDEEAVFGGSEKDVADGV